MKQSEHVILDGCHELFTFWELTWLLDPKVIWSQSPFR